MKIIETERIILRTWKEEDTIEIGWRLGSEYWGGGYATEGARVVLEYGFRYCALKEIVAFTVQENVRSMRVMEKNRDAA